VNKSEIRKKIFKIRKQNKHKNKTINFKFLLKILKKEKFKGKIIGGYYPYNHELDPMKILEKFEKKNFLISLPKIKKNFQMDFFEWSSKDPLKVNRYGIPEPVSDKILYPDVLLVPLVAFDKDLNRVGYGGGFYDRYFKKIQNYKNIIKIGLAYSFQKVKTISANKNDIKLNYIVTEKKN
tara:strand:- start:354 stop:893 length:540 start_codon:yes stop_codon:yes gene_type:complete